MAAMSMNKAIHGAVRRDLRRFLDATARFEEGDIQRAAALGAAWDNFHAQLIVHHEGEHEIAWPALQAVGISAEQLAAFDAEHETMAAALEAANRAMGSLHGSAAAADAAEAHAALLELHGVTIAHLDHEEEVTEQVYLDNIDTPAIKEMGRKFGKVSPLVAGRFFAWVTDGASEAERAGIEGSVPKPVLMLIGGIFGFGYRRSIAPVWRS